MSKLVLLNGPAMCGKNIVVDAVKKEYVVKDRRCKDKLFELTQDLFCVTPDRFWEIYNDRSLKEKALPDFKLNAVEWLRLHEYLRPDSAFYYTGSPIEISIRYAMIYVSEIICKPAFGQDYFGVARAKDIGYCEFAIDDSCGFNDEIQPAIDKLGQDGILLIRIHGRGSFEGDSREYIRDGVVDNTVDVYNTGSEEEYVNTTVETIVKFYRGY